MASLIRKSHFLGSKIRSLRKRNGLTLQDVSTRCIQVDAEHAPSVSYLSMIERGKRVPSRDLLGLLASVFQKDERWFLDENAELETPEQDERIGGVERIPLEPGFLFSKDLLEAAIPELLSQTGTTGRQFAHLLIRSYQEMSRNEFPDIERSAEEAGQRKLPLGVDDLKRLYKKHGLTIRWFDTGPGGDDSGTLLRSFFEAPRTVYLNSLMKQDPARLKYDLAAYLGHLVLHDGDGLKSPHVAGRIEPASAAPGGMNTEDVLHAWRDFECSFFAGALLCPKAPFRRFLMREAYSVTAAHKLGVTPAVVMRRMTAASPYRYWHYFDAYSPGFLRAVYRGNGIPLPWGNMTMVTDPCPRWAVFRLLTESTSRKPASQISVLQHGERVSLYCCHSLRARDLAGAVHVLSVGMDLAPALASQGADATAIVEQITAACRAGGGEAAVPAQAREAIRSACRVLNVGWIETGLERPASIICPRSTACPRPARCAGDPASSRADSIDALRRQAMSRARA